MAWRTEFEECGLVEDRIALKGRHLLLTVDFEAFSPEHVPLWCEAMREWARCAERHRLPFSFFIAVEDVVRLRNARPDLYGEFLAAASMLVRAGSVFYAHNHGAFDPDTGRLLATGEARETVPGYRKRLSLFHSVVYRQQQSLSAWLVKVRELHERFLQEVGGTSVTRPAFRAGGWDYGSTALDFETYLKALREAGFSIDSSACAGVFGTPTWRVGTTFGANAYVCVGGIVELAPCWVVDCGIDSLAGQGWRQVLPLRLQRDLWTGGGGACVVVLHFDHLFSLREGADPRPFVLTDPNRIAGRIARLCRLFSALRHVLRFQGGTFESVSLDAGCLGAQRPKTP